MLMTDRQRTHAYLYHKLTNEPSGLKIMLTKAIIAVMAWLTAVNIFGGMYYAKEFYIYPLVHIMQSAMS